MSKPKQTVWEVPKMVGTEAAEPVKKAKAKPRKKKLVLAKQTETPGPMTPALKAIQAAIDNPEPIIGLVVGKKTGFFKCNRKTGKWFQLDEEYLSYEGAGYEIVAKVIGRTTLVNVAFHAKEATAVNGGCGETEPTDRPDGNLAWIGYASGQVMKSGEIRKETHLYGVKYDKDRHLFLVDGLPVTGADALILGDNCVALVVGPHWR